MSSVAETKRRFERGFLARGALLLGALSLGLLIAAGAQATTISVELSGLTGPLPYRQTRQPFGANGDGGSRAVTLIGRSESFELETAFASISEISLHLVGHTECPEGGCSPAPVLDGFIIAEPPPVGTSVLPSPAIPSGPLSGQFEITLSLPAVQGLEGGQGQVTVDLANALPSRPPYTLPTEPLLVITSARLTVVGDALGDGSLAPQTLPEPSELALAGVALAAFGVRRRRSGKPQAS